VAATLAGLLALLLAGLLTGCTGDETDDAFDLIADSDAPLTDYLGFPPGVYGGTDDAAALTAQQLEQAVSDCMANAGFQYVPEVDEPVDVRQQADGIAPDTEAWVAKYGFGISTLAFPQQELSDGLVGFTVTEEPADQPDAQDSVLEAPSVSAGQAANEAYLEGLNSSDQAAYLDALYGLGLANDEADADETPGCFEAAVAEVNVAVRVDFFVEFADGLALAYQDIDLHPAVLGYRQEVLACLTEADQSIEADLDAVSTIRDRLLIGLANVYDLLADAGTAEEAPFLTVEAAAALAELQAEEVRLAQLVDRCNGETGAEEAAIAEARADVERDFIEGNRDALDAFLETQATS
jgi:hypothetical protein